MYGAALSGQAVWFLGSVVVGAAAMLLYSLVRVFTRGMKKTSVAVALGDIIFFALLACLEFLFVFMLPQNAFRWFHLLGQVLGGILFWLTLAPFFFRFILTISKFFASIYEKTFDVAQRKNSLNNTDKNRESK